MTEQQILQRLLNASLHDDQLQLPNIAMPFSTVHSSHARYWAASAAAVASIAIAIPAFLRPSQPAQYTFEDTCHSPGEAAAELRSALAQFHATPDNGDLLNLLK